MSEWPYLLIEECLYSMCEMIICLITVPIVGESENLEVTSIIAMEVTSVGLAFHSG